MMDVKVVFFSIIKFDSGLDEVQIRLAEESTISDLVDKLDETYGDNLMRFIKKKDLDIVIALFLVDNKMRDLDYILKNDDEVLVMPSVAGG